MAKINIYRSANRKGNKRGEVSERQMKVRREQERRKKNGGLKA